MELLRLAASACFAVLLAGQAFAQQRLYDPDPLCVLVFGDAEAEDAVTAGEVFAGALERFLEARQIPAIVQPALRSGETALGALARLDTDVLAREPDLVVWRFGWQDNVALPADAEPFTISVRSGLSILEQRGIQTLVLTAPPRTDQEPGQRLAARLDELRRMTGLSGAALLDAHTLMIADLQGDFENRAPERLDRRGQEQLARLVAEHIVRLDITPRTFPLRRQAQALDLVLAGAPTPSLLESAGPSLELTDEQLDTQLVLGSGEFEAEWIRRPGAELRLGLNRTSGLEFSSDGLVLTGALFGGGERSIAVEPSDTRVVLRRRGPRRLELWVQDRLVRTSLWAADLGTLRLSGSRVGCAALRVSGNFGFVETSPPFGVATETVRLSLSDLATGSPRPQSPNPKRSFPLPTAAPPAKSSPLEPVSWSFLASERPGHWLAFRGDPSEPPDSSEGSIQPTGTVEVCESFNDGRLFSSPRTILRHPSLAFWSPIATLHKDRILLFLCEPEREVVHLSVSRDRGRTFSTPSPLGADLSGLWCDVEVLRNGDLLIACVSEQESLLWCGDLEDLTQGRAGRFRISLSDPILPVLEPGADGSFALASATSENGLLGEHDTVEFFPDDLEALVQERLAR